MMKRNRARMWVDPLFKTKFKQLATQEDMNLLEYTRRVAKDDLMSRPTKKEFRDVFKI